MFKLSIVSVMCCSKFHGGSGLGSKTTPEKDSGLCVSLDELCVSSESLSEIVGGGDRR